MKTALLIILAAAGLQAQPARLDIFIHATNATDILPLRLAIEAATNPLALTNDPRIVLGMVRTNSSSGLNYQATLLLVDSARGDTAWRAITNLSRPLQSSGMILFHHCPADGDPRFRNWSGCDAPAAQLRRFQWP